MPQMHYAPSNLFAVRVIIIYNSVNPSFTLLKVGFEGVKTIKACFRDETAQKRGLS